MKLINNETIKDNKLISKLKDMKSNMELTDKQKENLKIIGIVLLVITGLAIGFVVVKSLVDSTIAKKHKDEDDELTWDVDSSDDCDEANEDEDDDDEADTENVEDDEDSTDDSSAE